MFDYLKSSSDPGTTGGEHINNGAIDMKYIWAKVGHMDFSVAGVYVKIGTIDTKCALAN
jgi:hypothetical protein